MRDRQTSANKPWSRIQRQGFAGPENPYAPPSSLPVEEPLPEPQRPALLLERIAAWILDAGIPIAIVFLFYAFFNYSGVWEFPPWILKSVLMAAPGLLVVWALGNLHHLSRYSRSLGKRLLGIRIVDREGNPVPLPRLLLLRWIPFGGLVVLPYAVMFVARVYATGPGLLSMGQTRRVIGVCVIISLLGELIWLMDRACYLLPGRRCLHDRLAGTRVVNS
jgi:uncharacterized RDD family membrane protein YckC